MVAVAVEEAAAVMVVATVEEEVAVMEVVTEEVRVEARAVGWRGRRRRWRW